MKTIITKNFHLYFIILMIIKLGCASRLKEFSQEELLYSKIIDFHFSKDELYKYSLQWANSTFKGIQKFEFSNQKTSVQDKVLNNDIENSFIIKTIISTGTYKVQNSSKIEIQYICKIECKENKARISFTDCKYISEDMLEDIAWNDNNRGMRKRLIIQFDSFISDFSKSSINQSLNRKW